jgi:hypothetical protein
MYAPKGTLLYAPLSLLLLYSLQALQCALLLQLLQSQPAAVLVSAPTSTCEVNQNKVCTKNNARLSYACKLNVTV